MQYLQQAVFAALIAALLSWQIGFYWKKSTAVGIALTAISASFALYLAVRVPGVESFLERSTGVTAISSLIKSLIPSAVAFSCIFLWWRWQVSKIGVFFCTAVTLLIGVNSVLSWVTERRRCGVSSSFHYDVCSLRSGYGAISEALLLSWLALIAVVTAYILRLAAGVGRREQFSATILICAVLASVLWTTVAIFGIHDIYAFGSYSEVQYVLRPPLALTSSLLVVSAALFSPVASLVTRYQFQRRAVGIADRLGVPVREFSVDGSSDRLSTVELMDGIGVRLEESGVCLIPVKHLTSGRVVAQILLGNVFRSSVVVPADADVDTQRRWIMSIDKCVRCEYDDR